MYEIRNINGIGGGWGHKLNNTNEKLARASNEKLPRAKKKKMNRVAVFGNAGAGKSSLSKQLSEITGLPWFPLDRIQYQPGGK